ncbi:adenylyl-sulfate kinase [Sulfurimonas sp. MAG313]|nr:adenylyl-sulfate kinase [Sulfurimonas sp. MAG313]MDF1880902.1 adenylyl-sulfate kinase [Sulfurimonas sp. MAG313]
MSNNIIHHAHELSKMKRSSIKNQKPCVLWFTGLSGSGKSTIANALEIELHNRGKHTYLLDGDTVRLGLNKGLGFSDADRIENIRRIAEVSKLFIDAGLIVLTAFISPFEKDRKQVRDLLEDEFIEVFIDTPLVVCEQRDPKGLYIKARKGEIKNFTGIDSPYEAPKQAELHIYNDKDSIENVVNKILAYLESKGYLDA